MEVAEGDEVEPGEHRRVHPAGTSGGELPFAVAGLHRVLVQAWSGVGHEGVGDDHGGEPPPGPVPAHGPQHPVQGLLVRWAPVPAVRLRVLVGLVGDVGDDRVQVRHQVHRHRVRPVRGGDEHRLRGPADV